jgi:hypothetical protein
MAKTDKAHADAEKSADDLFNFVDEQDTLEGFEDINSQTVAIPFLKIMQPLTPELEEIENAARGDWFNSVTKELYGDQIEVVVLRFERVYIEWLPDRGGFVGYHTPENAERIATDRTFGKWKHGDNDLNEHYVYIVLLANRPQDGVMVLSLASTAIKTARQWNRMLTTHTMPNGQNAKPYYLRWFLKTEERKKDKYKWHGIDLRFSGYIDENLYLTGVKTERKALPDRQVDYAQIADQTSEAGTDGEVDENVAY